MQALRRREFQNQSEVAARAVLQEGRYGHLAVNGPQVRALNYALVGDDIYFHSAEAGHLQSWPGQAACLAVESVVAWIPSTWRHPDMACPATTYYHSVVVHGTLRAVTDLHEKARALQAFMVRYQPEGGYRTIDGDDPKYQGPLRALQVMALPFQDWCCKSKLGQHLQPEARQNVFDKLQTRGDYRMARDMARANPDLERRYPHTDAAGFEWREGAEMLPVEAAWRLLQTTYWAHKRDLATVTRKLQQATVVLSTWRDGELAAMARVVCDSPKVNWLYDVVVAERWRGQGVGQALLRQVLGHPAVQGCRLFLDTRDAMPLYARFGFDILYRKGDSTLMVLDRLL